MKNLKILALAILVLSIGTVNQAQAQTPVVAKLTVDSGTETAREGAKKAPSGDLFFTFSLDTGNAASNATTITVRYSAPLGVGTTADSITINGGLVTSAKIEDDRNGDNGTITITPENNSVAVVVQDVALDVRRQSGPITARVSVSAGTTPHLVVIDGASVVTVIDEVRPGVIVELVSTSTSVPTRGTGPSGESVMVTVEEGYRGAFISGTMLKFRVSNIPNEATLGVEGPDYGKTDEEGNAVDPGADDPLVEVAPGELTGETGEAETFILTLGAVGDSPRAAPDEFNLVLTLTANPKDDDSDVVFPLDLAAITVVATLHPEDDFAEEYTPVVTAFNIRSAQCTMLFPLVTYIQGEGAVPMFNTGFAIVNPGYARGGATGAITFTFYKKDTPTVVFTPTDDSLGTGLEPDGRLAPGSTYAVNLNELLTSPMVAWAELPAGHVHVRTDYTNCHGVGLIYGTMGIDQSYIAHVLDNDTSRD